MRLEDMPADMVLSYLERMGLIHLMERFDYNQSEVARVIGLNRTTLRKRLRAHGIIKPLKTSCPRPTLPPSPLRV